MRGSRLMLNVPQADEVCVNGGSIRGTRILCPIHRNVRCLPIKVRPYLSVVLLVAGLMVLSSCTVGLAGFAANAKGNSDLTASSTPTYSYPSGPAPINNCLGGGTCSGATGDGEGPTCVISSFSETAGDFLYVTVNYIGGTDVISSVTAGSVSASYIKGEFENSQSVAFYDIPSEQGGTVTVTVTLNTAEYGSCRAGQLSPGTTVGVVGAGNSTASGTSLSLTNAATHEPSLLLALFGNTRPSGSWGPLIPSGAWYDGPNPGSGTTSLGTGSGLVGYNDTASGKVTFIFSVAYAVSISGIAVEFYLQGPPTYYNYTVYDGNSAIYPTEDWLPFEIEPRTSAGWQNGTNDSGIAKNSVALSVPGNVGKSSQNAYFEWDPGSSTVDIQTSVSATGVSQFYADTDGGAYDMYNSSYQRLSLSLTGMPGTITAGGLQYFPSSNIQPTFDTGVNLTPGSGGGGSGHGGLPLVVTFGLDAAALIVPEEVGLGIGLTQVGADLGSFGPSVGSGHSLNPDFDSNGTITEWGQIDNGTMVDCQPSCNPEQNPGGENVFSQGIVVLTKIPGVELGLLHSGATLSIQAMNQLTNAQSSPLEYGPFANGASVNLSYPIQPAVSIGGTVELYPGTHASSAQVLLQQICSGVPTNFELTANASTGYWHFFADPGCLYSESATGTNPYQGGTLTSTTIDISGITSSSQVFQNLTAPNLNLAAGFVTFTESGLPNGWSWSVTLNGVEQGATVGDESAITFLEPNDTSGTPPGYLFTVTPIAGEVATPSSSHVVVNGQNVPPIGIVFAPNADYTVTISENGLPSGTDWSATVGSTQHSSTGTSIAFTGLPNGYYDWSVPSVGNYAPSPSGGQVTVSGGNAGASTTFQESGHGGGCVALGTPILTPTGYVPVQKLMAGEAVEEYNFASQHLVQGTFLSGNTTNVTQLIDVNNGWLYVTPTEQPIYIENSTFAGWLHDPQNLTTSDSIFDPVTHLWVHVTSVRLVPDSTVVFDVVTSGANNFVANGALQDIKIG